MSDFELLAQQYTTGEDETKHHGTVLHVVASMRSGYARQEGDITRRDILRLLFARYDRHQVGKTRIQYATVGAANANGHSALYLYLTKCTAGFVDGDIIKLFADRMTVYELVGSTLHAASILKQTTALEILVDKCFQESEKPHFFKECDFRCSKLRTGTCALFAYVCSMKYRYKFDLVKRMVRETKYLRELQSFEFSEPEVSNQQQSRCTLLQFAARRGDARLLRFFFTEVCDGSLDQRNSHTGDSALATYLRGKHQQPFALDIVEMMLDALNPVALQNGIYGTSDYDSCQGSTLLHIVCASRYVLNTRTASGASREDIILALLARGASMRIRNTDKETPLAYACRVGGSHVTTSFLQWLLDNTCAKETVNLPNYSKRNTALHYLAPRRNGPALFLLEHYGADPLIANLSEQQPLTLWYPKLSDWRVLVKYAVAFNEHAPYNGGQILPCRVGITNEIHDIKRLCDVLDLVEHGRSFESLSHMTSRLDKRASRDKRRGRGRNSQTPIYCKLRPQYNAIISKVELTTAKVASLTWRPCTHSRFGETWRFPIRTLFILGRAQWEPNREKPDWIHRYRYEKSELHCLPDELLQYICELTTHAPHMGNEWWATCNMDTTPPRVPLLR